MLHYFFFNFRVRFTKEQWQYMLEYFKTNQRPNHEEKLAMSKHLGLSMRTIMIFFCNRRTRLATKGHFWCDFKVYHSDAYRKYLVWWIWVWSFNMLPRVIFDVIWRYHSIYSSVTMVHSDMILSGECIKSLFLIKNNFYLAMFCLLAALFKVFLWVSH